MNTSETKNYSSFGICGMFMMSVSSLVSLLLFVFVLVLVLSFPVSVGILVPFDPMPGGAEPRGLDNCVLREEVAVMVGCLGSRNVADRVT